jgi:sugar phosphate isomerase/epimerase
MSKRFKFGMPVWYGSGSIKSATERAYRLGFDYIEFDLNTLFPEKLSRKEILILKNLNKYPLEIAFHAPLVGIDVTHPNNEIRNASLKVLIKYIKFAERLNGVYFNFHVHSYYFWLKNFQEDIYNKAFESLEKIVNSSKKINLTIENIPNNFFGGIKEFKKVLKAKRLHLCFDVGHAIKFEMERKKDHKASIKIIQKWCRIFREKILVTHLHSYIFKKNKIIDHTPFNIGKLNIKQIFDLLKQTKCKYILLEFYRTNKEELRVSSEHFKKSLKMCKQII